MISNIEEDIIIKQKTDEFISFLLSTESYKSLRLKMQKDGPYVREADLLFDLNHYIFLDSIPDYPIDMLRLFTNGYWNPLGVERKVRK